VNHGGQPDPLRSHPPILPEETEAGRLPREVTQLGPLAESGLIGPRSLEAQLPGPCPSGPGQVPGQATGPWAQLTGPRSLGSQRSSVSTLGSCWPALTAQPGALPQ
jgi:hypothetical protein